MAFIKKYIYNWDMDGWINGCSLVRVVEDGEKNDGSTNGKKIIMRKPYNTLPFESKSMSIIAGPARTTSSSVLFPLLVTTAYAKPIKSLGTVNFMSFTGKKIVSRPMKIATNNSEGRGVWAGVKEMVETEPGLIEDSVRGGNAFTGNVGFVDGHDSINPTARLNTSFNPRTTYPKLNMIKILLSYQASQEQRRTSKEPLQPLPWSTALRIQLA
jgi:prepilin-type processing-associated H-X9-DG protein